MVIVFLRRFVCPRQGSNNVLSVSSATLLVFGTALWIFNLLTLLEVDTVPTLELMGMQAQQPMPICPAPPPHTPDCLERTFGRRCAPSSVST